MKILVPFFNDSTLFVAEAFARMFSNGEASKKDGFTLH